MRKIEEFGPIIEQVQAMDRLFLRYAGKKVTMVLGCTGHGKSTLINYLQGKKLRQVGTSLRPKFEVDPTVPQPALLGPEIGMSISSATEMPGIYELADGSLICDTIGLFDNRGAEQRLLAYMALAFLIKACDVRSILLVLSVGMFGCTRATQLINLLEDIAIMTGSDGWLFKHACCCWTHVSPGTGQSALPDIRESFADIIERLNPEHKRLRLMRRLMTIIQESDRQYMVDFSTSESRDLINGYITEADKFPGGMFSITVPRKIYDELSLLNMQDWPEEKLRTVIEERFSLPPSESRSLFFKLRAGEEKEDAAAEFPVDYIDARAKVSSSGLEFALAAFFYAIAPCRLDRRFDDFFMYMVNAERGFSAPVMPLLKIHAPR